MAINTKSGRTIKTDGDSTPDPKYLIDWLSNVTDARDLYHVGTLICGPDERGYTLTDCGARKHVAATDVWVQLAKGGAYVQLEVEMA